MTVFQNNNTYVSDTLTFTAGTVSNEVIDLKGRVPMAIVTPASFGATSITFQASDSPTGTFRAVYNDTGAAITVTVSSTLTAWTDITSIFPASVQFVKLVSGTSITNTCELVSRNVE